MGKSSSPSRKTSHSNCKAEQPARRNDRISRHLIRLEAKLKRFTARGRNTSGLQKAIDQAEFALTYSRPQGKKGPSPDLPEGFPKCIPHYSSNTRPPEA